MSTADDHPDLAHEEPGVSTEDPADTEPGSGQAEETDLPEEIPDDEPEEG